MDEIRTEYIRWTAQVGRFGKKTRDARLVVWTCTEERLWVYWEKDAEEKKGKCVRPKTGIWMQ